MYHFFFIDTALTATYPYGHTLSLHDALPICVCRSGCWPPHTHDGTRPPVRSVPLRRSVPPAAATKTPRVPAFSVAPTRAAPGASPRSEEHTSELPSLMRISYAVFCLKQKNNIRLYCIQQQNLTLQNTH